MLIYMFELSRNVGLCKYRPKMKFPTSLFSDTLFPRRTILIKGGSLMLRFLLGERLWKTATVLSELDMLIFCTLWHLFKSSLDPSFLTSDSCIWEVSSFLFPFHSFFPRFQSESRKTFMGGGALKDKNKTEQAETCLGFSCSSGFSCFNIVQS